MTINAHNRAAFRWFGGKAALRSQIIPVLMSIPHSRYIEPFGGAASVLCAKPPADLEIYNDLDSNVVNFFQVLRDRSADLVRALELTPHSRAEWMQCEESAECPVERARRFSIRQAMSFHPSYSATKGGTGRSFRLHNSERSLIAEWERYPDFLAQLAKRWRGVGIEQLPALEIFDNYDHPHALFYCDPPYLHETRLTTDGYSHEMDKCGHVELLDRLAEVDGLVALSGYRSELYDDKLRDWYCHEFETRVGSPRRSARVDCLWLSPRCSTAYGPLFG